MKIFVLLYLSVTFISPLAHSQARYPRVSEHRVRFVKTFPRYREIYQLDSTANDDHLYTAGPGFSSSGEATGYFNTTYQLQHRENFDVTVFPSNEIPPQGMAMLTSCRDTSSGYHFLILDRHYNPQIPTNPCNGYDPNGQYRNGANTVVEYLGFIQTNQTSAYPFALSVCTSVRTNSMLYTMNPIADCRAPNWVIRNGFNPNAILGYVSGPATNLGAVLPNRATATSQAGANNDRPQPLPAIDPLPPQNFPPANNGSGPAPQAANLMSGDTTLTYQGVNYQFFGYAPTANAQWNDLIMTRNDGMGSAPDRSNLGGTLAKNSDPLAIAYNGDVYIFATSIQGNVEFMSLYGTQGQGWQNLGNLGGVNGNPYQAVSVYSLYINANQDLVVQVTSSADGSIWERTFDSAWFRVDTTATTDVPRRNYQVQSCEWGKHWNRNITWYDQNGMIHVGRCEDNGFTYLPYNVNYHPLRVYGWGTDERGNRFRYDDHDHVDNRNDYRGSRYGHDDNWSNINYRTSHPNGNRPHWPDQNQDRPGRPDQGHPDQSNQNYPNQQNQDRPGRPDQGHPDQGNQWQPGQHPTGRPNPQQNTPAAPVIQPTQQNTNTQPGQQQSGRPSASTQGPVSVAQPAQPAPQAIHPTNQPATPAPQVGHPANPPQNPSRPATGRPDVHPQT